ncbi:hypothetical protein Pint_02287 [Pistacia integerrima]|uniref:Uncharacterized protein n=1 Tax=Pistacia integerrima TaxID=434235 RepID=A0ACC0ZNE2_9ROSI|nr:hypothetical protein Pint_02287 [Pistacia integerrima]
MVEMSISVSGLPKQDSSLSEANNFKDEDEDEEYARIMSRLDELELEELAAESDNWDDDGKQSNTAENDNDSDEDKQAKADFDPFPDQSSFDHNLRHSTGITFNLLCWSLSQLNHSSRRKKLPPLNSSLIIITSRILLINLDFFVFSLSDAMSHGKALAHNANYISAEQSLVLPEVTENVGTMSSSGKEVSAQTSKAGFDSGKAQVVEHTHSIHTSTEKPSGTQPSKPVSRFKMQRK